MSHLAVERFCAMLRRDTSHLRTRQTTRGLATQSSRAVLPLIAFLLATLVYNVWGIGIVSFDDAMWHLRGNMPGWAPVWEWATSQGRMWALLTGPLMLHAAKWKGSFYGDLLQFLPFVVSFLLFHGILAIYFGRRIAILAAALFCSLFALRFDGSLLVSYALLAWPAASACCLAILAGRQYVGAGKPTWCVAAAVLFLLSLFTNEALAITFVGLFALAWLGNAMIRGTDGNVPLVQRLGRHDWILAGACVAVAAAYAVSGALFAVAFPSTYDGHALAAFDWRRFTDTLQSFALSGSTLYGILDPYSVKYTDHVLQSSIDITYRLADAIRGLGSAPLAILSGLAAAVVVWSTCTEAAAHANDADDRKLHPGLLLVPGLLLLLMPIIPVALTEKYQSWHLDQGVKAYVSTVACHFGTAMILAGAMVAIADLAGRTRGLGQPLILALSFAVGIAGMVSANLNSQMAQDIRSEGARWAVLDRALLLLDKSGLNVQTLLAPQFRNGSWFAVIPQTYWGQLVRAKHGKNVKVIYNGADAADLSGGLAMLSYYPSKDGLSFDLLLAHVGRTADHSLVIDRAVVEPGQRSTSRSCRAAS
jgi:hypothetical protein